MIDAHCAELNGKSFFLIGDTLEKSDVYRKIVNIISHNSKNKNKTIDFPFDSALCASILKIGPLLKLEGRGVGCIMHILS